MNSYLCVRDLFCAYGKKEIIKGISFSVTGGELCALVGANGSGKSTLLKAAAGLLPYRGSCLVMGEEAKALSPKSRAQKTGYLAQSGGSQLSLSVLDTVLLGFNPKLGIFGSPGREMRQQAVSTLAELGIEELAGRDFTTLSEGQKQLVLLARLLAPQPPVMIADEPDSALDIPNRRLVMQQLQHRARQGKGVLLCSHDINFALKYADRLLVLESGRLIGDVRPGEMSRQELCRLLCRALGRVSLVPDGEGGFLVGTGE